MSDIQKRLQESAAACIKCYEAWEEKKSDSKVREELQDSIHELRKVVSRLEIEIAVSERKNVSESPIPIPPHRSSSKDKGSVESILPDTTDTYGDIGNSTGGGMDRNKPRRNNNNRPRRSGGGGMKSHD